MRVALSHFAVGVVMGMADLVPGVSGGTIAFVSGRYERLVEAIRALDATAVGMLVRWRWKDLYHKLDLGLMLPLLVGIATSVVMFSGLLAAWLVDPIARPRLFSFFVGLVVASAVIVGRRVRWNAVLFSASIGGSALGIAIALVAPARTPATAAWAVLAGAMAICAMILPGISGSFILLLAGQYERAVEAVHSRDLATVGLLALGAVVGLLLFVRVLRWMLARYHDLTVAVLVGFILGTLPRLWPWVGCIDCVEFTPVRPVEGVLTAVGIAVTGAATIVVFERWAGRSALPITAPDD